MIGIFQLSVWSMSYFTVQDKTKGFNKVLFVISLHNFRRCLSVIMYCFSSEMGLANFTFRATLSPFLSLISACFYFISFQTSFSAHLQHTPKNKQQIRSQQKKCCLLLLAHVDVAQIWWWREGAAEARCRADGQGLIPSRLASFQPRGTNALLWRKAWSS